MDTRRSTYGYVFKLDGVVLSSRTMQKTIATSTVYVGYVACFQASFEVILTRNFIVDMRVIYSNTENHTDIL